MIARVRNHASRVLLAIPDAQERTVDDGSAIVIDVAGCGMDHGGDYPQLSGYIGTGETKILTKVTLRVRDRAITKLINTTSWLRGSCTHTKI